MSLASQCGSEGAQSHPWLTVALLLWNLGSGWAQLFYLDLEVWSVLLGPPLEEAAYSLSLRSCVQGLPGAGPEAFISHTSL